MLSDEEKKAIEILNRFNPLDCGMEDTQAIETLLNLIEKQSKEIEELKEEKGYHLGFIDGGIAKRYEMENKIKAKIEYYEKIDNPVGKRVLQSLLEKE